MKKFKKLLAGLLGTAMVMSSLTMTAFAAEPTYSGDYAGNGTPSTGQTTTDGTIDTTKRGSLTITKYEYNGTEAKYGTGSADDSVPDAANELKGATFTIYQVADATDLVDYYSSNPTALPSISSYVDVSTDLVNNPSGYVIKTGMVKMDANNNPIQFSDVTDEDGVAEFTDLPLGFYVVIETSDTDVISQTAAPFLVSIPMTTVDGSDWLYNVYTFPKNQTAYGKIQLQKFGKTATTADNTAAELNGIEFELRKLTGNNPDATASWTKIEYPASAQGDNDQTKDKLNLTTGQLKTGTDASNKDIIEQGMIIVDGLSRGTYRFYEIGRSKDVANGGYIIDTTTYYEFEVLKGGYVKYNGQTEDADNKGTTRIEVMNEKPDLDKEVKNAAGSWGQDADYSVGDTVPYRLTVKVPSTIDRLEKFEITDTPTNMQIDLNSVKVEYNGTSGDQDLETGLYEVDTTVYGKGRVDANDANGLKITFDTSKSLISSYGNTTITIFYNAVLLPGAVTTTAGQVNTAQLEYSNKTDVAGSGTDKITDQAVVYTFKLNLAKYLDSKEDDNLVDGVEFKLYRYDGAEKISKEEDLTTNNATLIYVTGSNGVYEYDSRLTENSTGATSTLVTGNGTAGGTNTQGKIVVTGLENGTYYWVETKTEEQYNLMKEPLMATLQIGHVSTWTVSSTWAFDGSGNATLTSRTYDVTSMKFTGSESESDGYQSEEVINKKGFTLPTTGGMGTMMFTIIGAILMLGGAFILFRSSKRKAA